MADGLSLDALKDEITSCEVVCVNCHRIRTARQTDSWRLLPAKLDQDTRLAASERRNMIFVRELPSRSWCVDCGDDRLAVLEFDHVGPKRANVVRLARRGCSLETLEDEVSHCQIRCANCHRRRTLAHLNLPRPGPTH